MKKSRFSEERIAYALRLASLALLLVALSTGADARMPRDRAAVAAQVPER